MPSSSFITDTFPDEEEEVLEAVFDVEVTPVEVTEISQSLLFTNSRGEFPVERISE